MSSSGMSYPVSMTGACPYCQSYDVVYLVLIPKGSEDVELPPLLSKLINRGCALKVPDGENIAMTLSRFDGTFDSLDGQEIPSFQCRHCGYGFNLDWTATSLETVFSVTSLGDNKSVHQPVGSTEKVQEQQRQQQHLPLVG